jgi:pimeloyl-ACP methyl ester carboxylesterase
MVHLQVNGVRLWYEEYGSGTPIVGVHGTPSSAVLWTDAARRLGEVGRCIVYDRRGFGRSDLPGETLDLTDHVDDLAALLAALDAEPAVVIGRSTGGLVALAFALRFPEAVRALVLLEPAIFALGARATAWAVRLRAGLLGVDPEKAGEAHIRDALGDDAWESLPDELRRLFAAASPAVLAEMHGNGMDLSRYPYRPKAHDLAELAHPTLVVAAEDSPDGFREVSDRLVRALPHAEALRVAGGHFIDPAHPAVLEFVRRASAES